MSAEHGVIPWPGEASDAEAREIRLDNFSDVFEYRRNLKVRERVPFDFSHSDEKMIVYMPQFK